MLKYIWIKNRRYYYYDTFNTWEEALKEAKKIKKLNKSKYFILQYEHGTMIPRMRFRLYLDNVISILSLKVVKK